MGLLTLAIRAVFTAVVIAALSVYLVQVSGTWDRPCDYDIKVWTVVWLGRSLFQVTLSWLMLPVACRIGVFRVLQSLGFLFRLCWWLYGIKPVLVDTRCERLTGTWGLVLWWIEFVIGMAPCLCFCLCFPVLYCLFQAEQVDETLPTPPDIRKKLKAVKYMDVQEYLETKHAEAIGVDPPQDTGESLRDFATAITGVPLPDMSQFKKLQSGLLGRPTPAPDRPDRPPDRAISNIHQAQPGLVGRAVDLESPAVSCPICFCDYERVDDVIELPCDPRHVFHSECLLTWLDKSQQCPVCRSNIVEAFQETDTNTT